MNKYSKLYDEIMADSEAEKIEYNISVNYVENLDAVFGIKEFIANFYDVNKENFLMDYKNKTLILQDDNKGIDISYMLIGNSGSREFSDKIGTHGEGFKVGALTLVRLGFKVLIKTVGYTICFGTEIPDFGKSEVMFAKYIENDNPKGTTLYTECTKQSFEKAKNMFLHLTEYQKLTDNIIDMEGVQKNIYLNGLSHTSKKALFAYNIFEKKLASSRDRNFVSMQNLKEEISSIYNDLNDEEVISAIMKKIMHNKDNFDKFLEAKILPELHLDAHQKELYCANLESNVYYRVKGTKVFIEGEDKKIIDVDNSLFQFLELIGANTLYSETETITKKDGIVAFYQFKKEEIPDSFDIESKLVYMLSNKIECDVDTAVILPNKGYGYNSFFPDSNLDEFFIKFKSSASVQSVTSYSVSFKQIFNNLLLLTYYDFDIEIKYHEFTYKLTKKVVNKNVIISVIKSKNNDNVSKIIIKKSLEFKNNIKEESNHYIYFGCLKERKINSLFSYQIGKNPRYDYYSIKEYISSVLTKYANSSPKKFYALYLEFVNQNIFEYEININPSEKSKKSFDAVFENKFPNTVIKSDVPEFDSIVRDNYGYKLLEVENNNCLQFLSKVLGIKTSSEIFIEKQKETIHTITNTEEIEEAIRIFETTHNVNVPIFLTPILPNQAESIHKDGNIYISETASKIPLYLAMLIEYEYAQLVYSLKKKTKDMQSHLTHHILG